MRKFILAHDIGTSGNKATLYTLDGDLVKSSTFPYNTVYGKDNWAEQDPNDWWKAVCKSTQDIISGINTESIRAVAMTGQMMGCICVNRKGIPLRNSIIYCDQRSVKEANQIINKISPQHFYQITGHRISAVYSVEKLLWIKNNQPDIYRNTYKMLNAKDYILFKLTHRFATDHTDASGTNIYDIRQKQWSEKIIDILDLDHEKLPNIYESTEVIGGLTREAAVDTGLLAGTPVVIGAGDGSAAGVGVGCIEEGSAYTYLGSSAWVATSLKEPFFDDQMRTMTWMHAVPGYYHSSGSMQSAGSSYKWLKDEVCLIETKEAESMNISPYELIDREAKKSTAGSNGLVFLPYLIGERSPLWDPHAKGAIIGIKLSSKRGDIIRAVLEGVAFNLKLILDIFKSKISINEISLVGGGAKGEIWSQIISDIYESRILIPDYVEEVTSRGAAVIGAVGIGEFKSFQEAKIFIKPDKEIEPNPNNQEVYRKLYGLFSESYLSLKKVFNQL